VKDYSYNEIRIEGIDDYADDTLYNLLGHNFTIVGPPVKMWPFWIPYYGFFIGMKKDIDLRQLSFPEQVLYIISAGWQAFWVIGGIVFLGLHLFV
jgi:hypothetical protein